MSLSYTKKAEGVTKVVAHDGETAADRAVRESKTYTCGHCNGIGHVNPEQAFKDSVILRMSQAPAVCHRCWSLVCPICHAKGTCTTIEQALIAIEMNGRFLRSAGLAD